MAEISNFESDTVGKAQVDKYNEALKKKKKLLGKTFNRVWREVTVSLYTFENMRDTGTLPKKKDWYNFVDFTPLSQEEIDEITRKNQNGLNEVDEGDDEVEETVKAPKTKSAKVKTPEAQTSVVQTPATAPVSDPEVQAPAKTPEVQNLTPSEKTPEATTPATNKLAWDDPFS